MNKFKYTKKKNRKLWKFMSTLITGICFVLILIFSGWFIETLDNVLNYKDNSKKIPFIVLLLSIFLSKDIMNLSLSLYNTTENKNAEFKPIVNLILDSIKLLSIVAPLVSILYFSFGHKFSGYKILNFFVIGLVTFIFLICAIMFLPWMIKSSKLTTEVTKDSGDKK